MANYLARVELKGAKYWDDYEDLHEAMERQGFIRTIATGDGTVKQLPPGTYCEQDSATATVQEAYKKVEKAASSTGFASQIVVVSFGGWWGNLDDAT